MNSIHSKEISSNFIIRMVPTVQLVTWQKKGWCPIDNDAMSTSSHIFNHAFNLKLRSTPIKVRYGDKPPKDMRFILIGLSYLYVGPMIEFSTSITHFLCNSCDKGSKCVMYYGSTWLMAEGFFFFFTLFKLASKTNS